MSFIFIRFFSLRFPLMLISLSIHSFITRHPGFWLMLPFICDDLKRITLCTISHQQLLLLFDALCHRNHNKWTSFPQSENLILEWAMERSWSCWGIYCHEFDSSASGAHVSLTLRFYFPRKIPFSEPQSTNETVKPELLFLFARYD